MTGMPWRDLISRKVSSPLSPGISRSRVMTCGFSSSIFLRPKVPSMAVPTTSMESLVRRICGINLRMSAESSTTSTRTGGVIAHLLQMQWPAGRALPARAAVPQAVSPLLDSRWVETLDHRREIQDQTTRPSPRMEAPLTRSVSTVSSSTALMTNSSSPSSASTINPNLRSPAAMTRMKILLADACYRRCAPAPGAPAAEPGRAAA